MVMSVNNKSWDTRYQQLAAHVATWSKDPNAKVGAVIVKNNRVIATGFNGFPTSVLDDNRLDDKRIKLQIVVHAEMNALLVAGDRACGSTIYVHGKPVCARCAASIIQTGISRVVASKPVDKAANNGESSSDSTNGTDWDESGRIAHQMFSETAIIFHHLELDKSDPVFSLGKHSSADDDSSSNKGNKSRKKSNG